MIEEPVLIEIHTLFHGGDFDAYTARTKSVARSNFFQQIQRVVSEFNKIAEFDLGDISQEHLEACFLKGKWESRDGHLTVVVKDLGTAAAPTIKNKIPRF